MICFQLQKELFSIRIYKDNKLIFNMKQHKQIPKPKQNKIPKKDKNIQPDNESVEQSIIQSKQIASEEQQEAQIEQNIEEQLQNDGQQHNNEEEDAEDYNIRQSNKGVCYLSRIPPYMKPNYIRKLLTSYKVQRIYLLAESEWTRKNRIIKGGNKKICFREGWVQFTDKRMAKLAALTLNSQKMVHKKGNFYSQDLWNIKYLPKFKWHHLTERLAHQQRMKKERLKLQFQQQRKIEQFYQQKISKSKSINGIVEGKLRKGKQINKIGNRHFQQYKLAAQINDN